MMIGGEFNTPADWLRAGNAITTIDKFAAAHDGNAPVFVFVDSGGAFNNDTECVNGPRGNAADHLTKDVVPFMDFELRRQRRPRRTGASSGWSMGGTCAVDLTVMHPDMFSAFVDIAGDLAPNSGTKAQTIAPALRRQRRRLGGVRPDHRHHQTRPVHRACRAGSRSPATAGPQHTTSPAANTGAIGLGGRDATGNPGDQTMAANSLCALGSANGIDCAVVAQPGKHDWPFAARAFACGAAVAGRRDRHPGDPVVPLQAPATPSVAAIAPVAAGQTTNHAQAAGPVTRCRPGVRCRRPRRTVDMPDEAAGARLRSRRRRSRRGAARRPDRPSADPYCRARSGMAAGRHRVHRRRRAHLRIGAARRSRPGTERRWAPPNWTPRPPRAAPSRSSTRPAEGGGRAARADPGVDAIRRRKSRIILTVRSFTVAERRARLARGISCRRPAGASIPDDDRVP